MKYEIKLQREATKTIEKCVLVVLFQVHVNLLFYETNGTSLIYVLKVRSPYFPVYLN